MDRSSLKNLAKKVAEALAGPLIACAIWKFFLLPILEWAERNPY